MVILARVAIAVGIVLTVGAPVALSSRCTMLPKLVLNEVPLSV